MTDQMKYMAEVYGYGRGDSIEQDKDPGGEQ